MYSSNLLLTLVVQKWADEKTAVVTRAMNSTCVYMSLEVLSLRAELQGREVQIVTITERLTDKYVGREQRVLLMFVVWCWAGSPRPSRVQNQKSLTCHEKALLTFKVWGRVVKENNLRRVENHTLSKSNRSNRLKATMLQAWHRRAVRCTFANIVEL